MNGVVKIDQKRYEELIRRETMLITVFNCANKMKDSYMLDDMIRIITDESHCSDLVSGAYGIAALKEAIRQQEAEDAAHS